MDDGMEFKDVLKERLEIEYTKRIFRMIPSIRYFEINFIILEEMIGLLKHCLTLKFD